jgi:hypothetical protein
MQETFRDARARRSEAVMLIGQANPGWDQSDPTRAPVRDPRTLAQTDGQPDGYADFLIALRAEPRGVRLPATDRAAKPDGRPGSLSGTPGQTK